MTPTPERLAEMPRKGDSVKTISLDYVGAGVILSAPSGVRYSNQVGGMACLHPTYEGVFVPLPHVELPHDCVDGHGCWGMSVSEEFADKCDTVFRRHKLPLTVDRKRLSESTECWIPVVVVAMKRKGVNWDGEWDQFVGTEGIYTTSDNCD